MRRGTIPELHYEKYRKEKMTPHVIDQFGHRFAHTVPTLFVLLS